MAHRRPQPNRFRIYIAALLLAVGVLTVGLLRSASGQPKSTAAVDARRTHSGLLVLYDFRSDSGDVVKDRSGVGPTVDLRIENSKAVRRRAGELEIRSATRLRSEKPAGKIHDAVRNSGQMTVEAWVRPANTRQDGPARIVSLSKNTSERNFTLGQEGDKYDFRLRTTRTSNNGLPSLSTPGRRVRTELTHVAYTRGRDGRARIYLNGRQSAERDVAGDMSNWDASMRLALANEHSGDRLWLGTYHLVAIYGRQLSAREIEQNFQAGCATDAVHEALAGARRAKSELLFHERVAPLLVRHCFECHDATTKKGGLDLSRKTTAQAGGESGKAVVPGKADESLLWEHVATDEMPQDREPLADREKEHLREWIDAGAAWPAEVIDPAIYAYGSQATETIVQRLTVPEYIETVRSSLGIDIAKAARETLPPDLRADGFNNTAYNLNVDLKHVEAYAQLARIIVERLDMRRFAAEFTNSQKLDEKNMRRLVSQMGKWMLRGPLADHEVETYLDLSSAVARSGGDFDEAVALIVEAMLQSPRFIYRIEQQGSGPPRPVGNYELASRLSYIIWGGPPDRELMRAADRGELSDPGKVEAQVRRMLEDSRAVERSQQFLSQWLHLGRLNNLKPNSKHFPDWEPQLADEMREETLAFFTEIAWKQNRPLSELFNAQVTFATPKLAEHYDFEARETNKGLNRYDLSKVPGRGGLLTQASVLTVGGDEASMVSRGLFVLHDVLRGTVKDPPPCVDTTPVPTKAGLSQRSIAEARIANKACGGCHAKFEPLAFGLERFDGLGVYRQKDEHGNALREDGEILFPGSAKPVAYETSAELMDLLAGSDRVRQTITWKLAQFALGRPLTATDSQLLHDGHDAAWRRGGTYADLITALVMSDLVQKTRMQP